MNSFQLVQRINRGFLKTGNATAPPPPNQTMPGATACPKTAWKHHTQLMVFLFGEIDYAANKRALFAVQRLVIDSTRPQRRLATTQGTRRVSPLLYAPAVKRVSAQELAHLVVAIQRLQTNGAILFGVVRPFAVVVLWHPPEDERSTKSQVKRREHVSLSLSLPTTRTHYNYCASFRKKIRAPRRGHTLSTPRGLGSRLRGSSRPPNEGCQSRVAFSSDRCWRESCSDTL